MAIREEANDTVGRVLINESDPDNKIYVRSYRKNGDGYSQSDEQLEAWLKSRGYKKASDWEGCKLKVVLLGKDYLAPYLDGNIKRAVLSSDESLFRIDDDGPFAMDNTDGYVSQESSSICEDCEDRFHEDDGYWVNEDESRQVCDNCCSSNYTYAYSRRGNQYYIHSDDVVYVNGEYYDTNYAEDNDIRQDVDGEYQHLDDLVFVESECEWYPSDDDRICYAQDIEGYENKDDCWKCEQSGDWYTDDCEDYVEIDGNRYHKDNAPEQTKEETNE
jgi:hypothetical protein